MEGSWVVNDITDIHSVGGVLLRLSVKSDAKLHPVKLASKQPIRDIICSSVRYREKQGGVYDMDIYPPKKHDYAI